MGALALIGGELVFFGLSLALMQAALRWRRQGGLFQALPWGLIPALVMAGYLFNQLQQADGNEVAAFRKAWVEKAEVWSSERFPKPEQKEQREDTRKLAQGIFELLPAAELCMRMMLLAAMAVLLRRRAQRQGQLPVAPPLLQWTASVLLLWLVIGPVFVLLAQRHGALVMTLAQVHLAWNVLAVGLAIYLFQGLVVFGAKLAGWGKDPRTRGLAPLALAAATLSLLFFNGQGLIVFLVLTGLFEPWMDLRRLSAKSGEGRSSEP